MPENGIQNQRERKQGFVETFINFFMGFSTALLPAMIFITYFLHKNGHEVTSELEKQLHATMVNLNTTRESLITFKKRLANSEKNNIELTKVSERLKAELDQARADDGAGLFQKTETAKTTTTTENTNTEIPVEVTEVKNPEPINVEKIEDQQAWVKEQLALVKAQLTSISVKKEKKIEAFTGYVYVIANDDWLGEGQLLIRATRRLEPMDVVKDLGADPKRFQFEVKMVLFNQNAPELESNLHKALQEKSTTSKEIDAKLFSASVSEVSTAMVEIQKNEKNIPKEKAVPQTAATTIKRAA